jgi:dihydroorotate dehydrogenase electron transfer subunit
VGDIIDLLGPLGRPFDLSIFHGKQEDLPTPILVGGGVGVPPMVALGETLTRMNLAPLAIIGARSAPEILCEVQFAALGITPLITTEDGSLGRAGRVTALLEEALERDRNAVVYSCGPFPMLRAVAALAACYGARCQVSMEENMPCGIGVCNGCVVAMLAGDSNASDYERYRRICIEGPAVWADEIDWETS